MSSNGRNCLLSLSILADECVDFRIVNALRKQGFHVISVIEESPSIPDCDVLQLAKSHHAILLTEDSDTDEYEDSGGITTQEIRCILESGVVLAGELQESHISRNRASVLTDG